MPWERIDSVDDPRVSVYRDLPRSNLTRPSGLFIAEGWLVVERLLRRQWPLESVLLEESFRDELGDRFPPSTTIYEVPRGLVSQIVGFKFHRGVLACGRRAPETSIDVALRSGSTGEATRFTVVVAADINDPENMGCILRNSAAFGVDLVLVSRRCADPFSRRVLRTSMGTVFGLNLVTSDDLPRDMRRLQDEHGVELAATVLDDSAESLHDARRGLRFGLVFGNEGHGIEEEVARECRRKVTLPMQGGTDSLNVGVASGIFLYHFQGPRSAGPENA